MTPIDLVSAHPWRKAFFTTYSLSLSFFESVVLDALTRGGARQVMIAADVAGVGAALGEWGARSVGRAYQVEPVGVNTGIFHSKVTVLVGEGECHMLVGSGNLTFGGWGGNLEVVEHLHPSFASEAFADAADMFEGFASAPHMRHGLQRIFVEVAADLRAAQRPAGSKGAFRLLYGSLGSISDEIGSLADDLGGAKRLAVVSPFFDEGVALDRLCTVLGLDEVAIHAHPAGAVYAHQGANWPKSLKNRVKAITVNVIADDRPLHGKLFEVSCRNGRILVSGSANATAAALGAGRNAEAVVARIQRGRHATWVLTRADAPAVVDFTEGDADQDAPRIDVLRATLAGHRVEGRVLTKRIEGDVEVFLVGASGQIAVGRAVVDHDGFFEIEAALLGRAAWRSDRLVIAISDAAGNRAEGFILAKDFEEVARRVGPLAGRLFALLAGTETPTDVAAIMSWFCENPTHLKTASSAAGSSERHPDGATKLVSLSELLADNPGCVSKRPSSVTGGSSWSGFIQQLLAAFREPRGPAAPFVDSDREDDEGDEPDVPPIPIDRSRKPSKPSTSCWTCFCWQVPKAETPSLPSTWHSTFATG